MSHDLPQEPRDLSKTSPKACRYNVPRPAPRTAYPKNDVPQNFPLSYPKACPKI
jgi:hypothetical protein